MLYSLPVRGDCLTLRVLCRRRLAWLILQIEQSDLQLREAAVMELDRVVAQLRHRHSGWICVQYIVQRDAIHGDTLSGFLYAGTV